MISSVLVPIERMLLISAFSGLKPAFVLTLLWFSLPFFPLFFFFFTRLVFHMKTVSTDDSLTLAVYARFGKNIHDLVFCSAFKPPLL